MNRCHYCDVAKPSTDLRPYGPAGELVCFPCATAPERKATTKGRMTAALAAAEEASVAGAAILKPGGFSPGRPYLPPPPVLAAARMAVRKFTSTLFDGTSVTKFPSTLPMLEAARDFGERQGDLFGGRR